MTNNSGQKIFSIIAIGIVVLFFAPRFSFAETGNIANISSLQTKITDIQSKISALQEIIASYCAVEPIEIKINKPDSLKGATAATALKTFNHQLEVLLKALQESKQKPSAADIKKIRDLAKERKKQLIAAMRENSGAALSIFSEDFSSQLAVYTKNCQEKSEVIEGSLEVEHADFFEQNISRTQYALNTLDRQKIAIHPVGNLTAMLESGTKAKIKGIKIDDELVFDAGQPITTEEGRASGIEVISQPGNPPVLGDQKIAVILVNFQNTAQPDLSAAAVENIVLNSINNYYKENSYNLVSLSGQVLGWYQIPIDHVCSLGIVTKEAVEAIDPIIDFNVYSRVMVVAPFSCSWAGVASFGKISIATQEGIKLVSTALIDTDFASQKVIGHELGHNFGNNHAGFLNCSDPLSNISCPIAEYGDPYDIMGGSMAHFSAFHKENVGWLPVIDVKSSGNYAIAPLELATTTAKAFKIRRGPGERDYLYAEYRKPIGFDAGLSGDIFTGAAMHLAAFSLTSDSRLIDTTPPASANSPVLQQGGQLTDPLTKSKITVLAVDPTSLAVNIVLGKNDFTAPTVSFDSPAENAVLAGLATFTASASDISGIQKVEFYYNNFNSQTSSPVLFAADAAAPYSVSLNTLAVPDGTYAFYAKAYDLAGSVIGDASFNNAVQSPAKRIFIMNNPDMVPPSVSIRTSSQGGPLSQFQVIMVDASDNVGIAGVQVKLDGNNLGPELIREPFNLELDFTTVNEGVHILTAVARDPAGNTAVSAPLTVVVDRTPPVIFNIITSNITTSTAIISFTTNEPAKSVIKGPLALASTNGVGGQITVSDFFTASHAKTIAGLQPSTTYSYNIVIILKLGIIHLIWLLQAYLF